MEIKLKGIELDNVTLDKEGYTPMEFEGRDLKLSNNGSIIEFEDVYNGLLDTKETERVISNRRKQTNKAKWIYRIIVMMLILSLLLTSYLMISR